MQSAAINGPRDVEVVEEPDPRIAGEFATVKVHVAPMCTEYKAYKAGRPSRALGHEAAGEVVAVAQDGRVAVGDRVVVMPTYPCGRCRYCLSGDYIYCQSGVDPLAFCGSETGTATYAQYLIKQDWMLIPIPDGMSYEHASMACCGLGPTFGAMQSMGVDRFDTILITGLGPVGLGGVVNAVYRGARVIAVESHPYRADLARRLGAHHILDPNDSDALSTVLDLTDGLGVDCGLDCTGVPDAQRFLIDAVRRRGQVTFVGEGGEVPIHASRDTIRKGLSIRGSWHWNMADAPRMMRMIGDVTDQLDRQITHHFSLADVGRAFELQLTGACGKILLHPWD